MTAFEPRVSIAPFTPTELRLVPLDTAAPLATATTEPVAEVLSGPALRLIIAERIEQIQKHGHLPDHDISYDQAELALAAKAYHDTYIDLALSPHLARKPGDLPESWPWQGDFWKEPGPHDQVKALVKAIALSWAELDRVLAAQAILHAARPLAPHPSPPRSLFAIPMKRHCWQAECDLCGALNLVEANDAERGSVPCHGCESLIQISVNS